RRLPDRPLHAGDLAARRAGGPGPDRRAPAVAARRRGRGRSGRLGRVVHDVARDAGTDLPGLHVLSAAGRTLRGGRRPAGEPAPHLVTAPARRARGLEIPPGGRLAGPSAGEVPAGARLDARSSGPRLRRGGLGDRPGVTRMPDLHNARVLVTGGAGFIGSHLVDLLQRERNAEVTVLDNLEPQSHRGRPPWIPEDVRFLEGDVRDPRDLRAALDGVRFVFHLAAFGGFTDAASKYVDVNATGTVRLYETIRE